MTAFSITSQPSQISTLENNLSKIPTNIIPLALDAIKRSEIGSPEDSSKFQPKVSHFISTQSSETIEAIKMRILEADNNPTALNHLQTLGFETAGAFAIATLEKALINQVEAKIDLNSVWMASFLHPSLPIPDPIPDVIGTDEDPGVFALRMENFFSKLREKINKTNDLNSKSKEELEATLAAYQQIWTKFKKCVKENPQLELFSRDEIKRKNEYLGFCYQLSTAFPFFEEQNLEEAFFQKDGGLEDLPQVCHTGWQHRCQTLLSASNPSIRTNIFETMQTIARSSRRAFITERVLSEAIKSVIVNQRQAAEISRDVHYQNTAKQWGNDRFGLGYSEEELGASESSLHLFLDKHLRTQADKLVNSHYSTEVLCRDIINTFTEMSSTEREAILKELKELYKKACQENKSLLLSPLTVEKKLYQRLKTANDIENPQERHLELEQLRRDFTANDISPPFSLLSRQESLEIELKKKHINTSFLRAFNSLKDERNPQKRAGILKKTYEDLNQEQQSKTLEHLIEQISETAQNPQREQEHLSEQRRLIASRAEAFEDYLLERNASLLENMIAKNKTLELFGAILLGSMTGLFLSPSHKNNPKLKTILGSLKIPISTASLVESLKQSPSFYTTLPAHMKALPEIKEAIKDSPWLLCEMSRNDYFIHISNPKINLETFSNEARSCREFVLKAVQLNPRNLKHADASLRNDREFVLAALSQSGEALIHAGKEFRNDREIVSAAVSQNGKALAYASDALRADKELVLKAILSSSIDDPFNTPLAYASDNLQADREFILEIIKISGKFLFWADLSLRNDKEIVITALNQNPMALEYAESLRDDRETVLTAIVKDPLSILYASSRLRNDVEIGLVAIEKNPLSLSHFGKNLLNNKQIILAAVEQNGLLLNYASEELRRNKEVVLVAVRQTKEALKYADQSLQTNRKILIAAGSTVDQGCCTIM